MRGPCGVTGGVPGGVPSATPGGGVPQKKGGAPPLLREPSIEPWFAGGVEPHEWYEW